MKPKIAAAFAARYPEMKQYQVEGAVEKYVDVMLHEIADAINNFGLKDDQFSLALNDIREKIGRVSVAGKKQWTCALLNASPSTSLVQIDFKGNEGKNSRVSFNPRYEADVWDALVDWVPDVEPVSHIQNWDIYTPVMPEGLDSFIENTSAALREVNNAQNQDVKKARYKIKLLRNLLAARSIRQMIVEENGRHWLGQNYEQADSGRYYGHGVNLQHVSKEVRHAALGWCHQYDIMAASYALMTGLAQSINPSLETAVLVDYAKNRSQIRQAIAESVGITEKKMKTVFTSLGFGARTANNRHSSIRKLLGADAHKALMANSQFLEIKAAMDLVRKVIANFFPDSFAYLGRQYTSACTRTGKQRNADQKLAWIYQVMESDVITYFGQRAQEEGYDPILFVHDCVYFKRKLPGSLLEKIFDELRVTYPLVDADHERIEPIRTVDHKNPEYVAADQQVAKHKLLMRQLEADAVSAGEVTAASTFDPISDEFEPWMTALYGRAGEDGQRSGQKSWLGTSALAKWDAAMSADRADMR